MCIQHFKDTDYSKRKNGVFLKANAVPSIFNVTNHSFKDRIPSKSPSASNPSNLPDIFDDTDVTEIPNDDIDDVESYVITANDPIETLESQIRQLKTENSILRSNHDIQIQILKQKIKLLEDKKEEEADTLNQTRSQLCREKSKTAKMNQIIDEMKKNRHINGEAVENVRYFPCLMLRCLFRYALNLLQFFLCRNKNSKKLLSTCVMDEIEVMNLIQKVFDYFA